jgi:hypothetical protein
MNLDGVATGPQNTDFWGRIEPMGADGLREIPGLSDRQFRRYRVPL